MKCPKCQFENSPSAKFCSECGAKLQGVCPHCGAQVGPMAKFCSECGTALTLPSPLPAGGLGGGKGTPPAGVQPQAALPQLEEMYAQLQRLMPQALAERTRFAEQGMEGENRLVTALFADISGFTALSTTRSAEAMFQLIQECFKELVNIVAGYEGCISGFRGDGLLALFGAPILHENDAERAIRVAIDMREMMRQRGLEITVGINTALMTVGEIQTQLHKEYTAYGTDINLAARLQQAATRGQIFVGVGTYRHTRRAFDFQRMPPLTLKGLGTGIVAYEVLRPKVHPEKVRGIEGLRARMIGREKEFAELKDAADGWLAGGGQIVSIIGEAGIGKSRLVTELKAYLRELEGSRAGGSPVQKEGKEGREGWKDGRMEEKQSAILNPQSAILLEGRCVSIGQPISYWPFLDILRVHFGLSESDSEGEIARKVIASVMALSQPSEGSKPSEGYAKEILPFIGRLLSIRLGNELDTRLDFATPDQIRHQTLMRLRDFFEALAKKRFHPHPASPVEGEGNMQRLMLIFEDLHWADDLSLDLLSLLMDSLATTPLMLLCVYRPEREHRVWQLSSLASRKCLDRYTEISLKQLSSHHSRRLVEELLTIDNLPESVKEMILRKSEGNPFFIEEVIRSLIEQDVVYREGDRWVARAEIVDINVPDTIQSVVLARVDRLRAEAKHILQCASVIGRLFKYRLLEHLAQHERNLDRYLNEFEERELVYEERTTPELEYAFKHAFTQEATYQGILEGRRREFHQQVAAGIERLYRERLEEYYEELAHHYSRSGDAEKAAEYLLKAGEKAKRNYANEAAIAHFQRALGMLEGGEIERKDWKLEALRGLGEVYYRIGKMVEAEQAFEKAVALAKEMKLSPRQLVRLYHWITDVLWWRGRYDEIIRYGEIGLELLEEDKECLEAALVNAKIAGINAWVKGNKEKWPEDNRKNMAIIKKLPYSVELGALYNQIVQFLAFDDRDFEAALDWSKEWETSAAQHHDLRGVASAWNLRGFILIHNGDHKVGLSYYQKSIEIDKRIGDDKTTNWSHREIGWTLLNLGNIEEAEKHTQLSLTMMEQLGSIVGIAWARSHLGSIVMCQHRWEEAIFHYQKSLEGFQAMGGLARIASAHHNLGKAHLKKDDYHQALQSFEEAANRAIEIRQEGTLAAALWGVEAAHRAQGAPGEFVAFCRAFKERHADAVGKLSLRQWYLEPAEPSEGFSHLAFADNFEMETIDPSWTWIDEFGDCAYRVGANGVEIHAANGRDLDGLNLSAPRLMREISGDFAVEVCLSPASDEKPMMGGLLVWKDKDNFLRFEIGAHGENEVRLHGYIGGKQQIAGRGLLDPKGFQNPSGLMLRLERVGDEFSAYCSADGEHWFTCGKITLPLNDPIQLGIHAIGMIDRTIYCGAYPDGTATVFRGFKLWTR